MLVHTEALAILVAQLATGPQDAVDVGAMEGWALEVLPVVARTRQAVLLLAMRVDGQDEVDYLIENVTRQTHEARAGILRPRRIEALGEEDLDVCESTKSVTAKALPDFEVDDDTPADLPLHDQPPS